MKPNAVNLLIGANVLAYALQALSPPFAEGWFALWPIQPIDGQSYFHVWQLVTYAFLHDTVRIGHLLFNMLGLWMFGRQVETALGPRRLFAIYFASIVTAAAAQLLVPMLWHAPPRPVLGASGGVYGLLLAYAALFPRQRVVPLLLPIPMPAWLFASLFAVLELFLGATGRESDVAHFAHLGGMAGSALVIASWRRRPVVG